MNCTCSKQTLTKINLDSDDFQFFWHIQVTFLVHNRELRNAKNEYTNNEPCFIALDTEIISLSATNK